LIDDALSVARNVARALRTVPLDPKGPPSPPGERFLGHANLLRVDPLGPFTRWCAEYGEAVTLRVPGEHMVLALHPEAVKHVLQSNAKNYTKQTRGFDKMRLFLGNGLVTSDGDFWKRQRRIAAPAFHRNRIEGFADTMTAATADMLARWATLPADAPATDAGRELTTLTMRIASVTLLGKDLSGAADAVGDALQFLTLSTNDRITALFDIPLSVPTPENRRYHQAVKVVDDLLLPLIAERQRAPGAHHDLLAMLLEARDEETGEAMTPQQLRDEAITIFAAGHETTSNALAWTFYLLARHRDVATRVYEEVDRALNGRAPTLADLPSMPYAKCVIQESMRLYPPAWIVGRRAIADDELCGYRVAAGTQVLISPFATHRHPKFWEDPEAFDPDRFSPERSAGRAAYAYLPFGGGPRVCIGNAFAMMEAQLILAQVSQRYRLELAPGARVEPVRGITLSPGPALPMHLRARSPRATERAAPQPAV
jgi:cytochrome P450